MACCVRAIATGGGGVPELIEDGQNGLLYPMGDVERMAAGAIRLLQDPAALEQMSRAARARAQGHFCASRVIPQYEAFYEAVIQRSQSYLPAPVGV